MQIVELQKTVDELKARLDAVMAIVDGNTDDGDDDDAMELTKSFIVPSFRPRRTADEKLNRELDEKYAEVLVDDLIKHDRRTTDYEDWYDEEMSDLITLRIMDVGMDIVNDSVRTGKPWYTRDEVIGSSELTRIIGVMLTENERIKRRDAEEKEKEKTNDFFKELDEIEMEIERD